MDVSIIVVSFNAREMLVRCLNSILTTVLGPSYEIVVVDNASKDGSPQLVASEYPQARLIDNETNLGFARANNQGIAVSSGRYILLLNSDAVLLPGTVRTMIDFMDAHQQVGVVGAQLLNPDGSFQGSYADFPSLLGELLLLSKLAHLVYPPTYPSYPAEQSREGRDVDWVSGACLMARRSAMDVVGLLDEGYFMYTEETDWCYRMRAAGWSVHYLPDAKVIHWSGQSAVSEPERKRSQLYRSKWLFMQKHSGRAAATIFYVSVRIASALKLVAWALSGFTPNRARRRRAIREVRSYALLLKEL